MLAPDRIEDRIADKIQQDERVKKKLLNSSNEEIKERLQDSINNLLKKHKNTRIFLIIMGKWVFLIYLAIKILIKALIIYYLYKKS